MSRPRHPKPTDKQRAGRAIRRAAQIIDDCGWVKGVFGDKETGFCAVGALDYGIHDKELLRVSRELMHKWFADRRHGSAMGFNDTPGRTKEQVLSKMRECADELDPRPVRERP